MAGQPYRPRYPWRICYGRPCSCGDGRPTADGLCDTCGGEVAYAEGAAHEVTEHEDPERPGSALPK